MNGLLGRYGSRLSVDDTPGPPSCHPFSVRSSDDARNENGHVRNAAAIALLDRGYGKPPQAIVGDDEFDPIKLVGEVRWKSE